MVPSFRIQGSWVVFLHLEWEADESVLVCSSSDQLVAPGLPCPNGSYCTVRMKRNVIFYNAVTVTRPLYTNYAGVCRLHGALIYVN